MDAQKTEEYRIVKDREKEVATIFVSREGRKASLSEALSELREFRKIDIVYEPSLLLNL